MTRSIRVHKIKVSLKKLYVRVRTAIWILFHPEAHWFLISINEDNLINLIQEKEIEEVDLMYHGLVGYNINMLCKNISERKDEIDYMLDKAAFEAEAIMRSSSLEK
jgi:hypothetical protein